MVLVVWVTCLLFLNTSNSIAVCGGRGLVHRMDASQFCESTLSLGGQKRFLGCAVALFVLLTKLWRWNLLVAHNCQTRPCKASCTCLSCTAMQPEMVKSIETPSELAAGNFARLLCYSSCYIRCLFPRASLGSGLDTGPGVAGPHAPRYGFSRRSNTTVQGYHRTAFNVRAISVILRTCENFERFFTCAQPFRGNSRDRVALHRSSDPAESSRAF